MHLRSKALPLSTSTSLFARASVLAVPLLSKTTSTPGSLTVWYVGPDNSCQCSAANTHHRILAPSTTRSWPPRVTRALVPLPSPSNRCSRSRQNLGPDGESHFCIKRWRPPGRFDLRIKLLTLSLSASRFTNRASVAIVCWKSTQSRCVCRSAPCRSCEL